MQPSVLPKERVWVSIERNYVGLQIHCSEEEHGLTFQTNIEQMFGYPNIIIIDMAKNVYIIRGPLFKSKKSVSLEIYRGCKIKSVPCIHF